MCNLEGADTLSRLIRSPGRSLVLSGAPIPLSSVFLAQAVLAYSPLSGSSIREFDMWPRLSEPVSTSARMPASSPLHPGSSPSVARALAAGLNSQKPVSAAFVSRMEVDSSMPELISFAPIDAALPHPPTVVSPLSAATVLPCGVTPLPANWQEGRNQRGHAFIIDHTNKKVTLSEPRSNSVLTTVAPTLAEDLPTSTVTHAPTPASTLSLAEHGSDTLVGVSVSAAPVSWLEVDSSMPELISLSAPSASSPLRTRMASDLAATDMEVDSPLPVPASALAVRKAPPSTRPEGPPAPSPFTYRDPYLNPLLMELIKTGSVISTMLADKALKRLQKAARCYRFDVPSEILFFKRDLDSVWSMVPTPGQRKEIATRAHLTGHFQQHSTVERLTRQFRVWWPAIEEDVARVVGTCGPCCLRLPSPAVHHPAIALAIPGIHLRIAMDLLLGLPRTSRGHMGILVIMEYLSKFVMLYVIQSKTAEEIAAKVLNYIGIFGPPQEILSDQGGEFVNGVLEKLCSSLGIEKRVTAAYSPATNGAVERFNRTLMRSLETLAADHPDDWDLSVDFVAMAYRTRVHSATKFTPFELTFGRPANLFTSHHHILTADSSTTESLLGRAYEIQELVEGTLPRVVADLVPYQAQQMVTQNNAVPVRLLPLPIGSLAYIFNNLRQKKMQARYKGPYKVAGVTQHGLYILANRSGQHLNVAASSMQLSSHCCISSSTNLLFIFKCS